MRVLRPEGEVAIVESPETGERNEPGPRRGVSRAIKSNSQGDRRFAGVVEFVQRLGEAPPIHVHDHYDGASSHWPLVLHPVPAPGAKPRRKAESSGYQVRARTALGIS